MDYRLELLDSGTFEQLTNTICQKLFGMGVVTFAEGKDGGRDGKFTGKAQNYPSTVDNWSGKFIVQAKHTLSPVASCSDSDFETTVGLEIKKIKKLRASGDIDNYMLFTNRKYTGIKGEELCKRIISETGINNAAILGKETINNQFINPNKDIIRQYGLDKHYIPFDFSDTEIKEIIESFKTQLPRLSAGLKQKVKQVKYDYDRIKIEEKNIKNNLGNEYYENEILSSSLMDFQTIGDFLSSPNNEEIKDMYFDVASELSQVITIKRNNFDAFEEVFFFIYKFICDGDTKIKGGKRHVTTFLHYMYFECLIGKK
ncbi:ABC-three component system protein [Pontibacter burrus]|uniref:ABC-three component systems C-terminal domain-containing protein n=1 Tax=Pontibacter burrus TaxID=2704466 RepID=A0A6B3M0S7_9BACT|nr:ABC-three component system protein [Pontibacter burrus]NEM99454.1 hypothetical protein [Pontibacter burrus]